MEETLWRFVRQSAVAMSVQVTARYLFEKSTVRN